MSFEKEKWQGYLSILQVTLKKTEAFVLFSEKFSSQNFWVQQMNFLSGRVVKGDYSV